MSDHAFIVPTSRGPVSAIVSEPEGGQRGALALLQGAGHPCRAGVNGLWTRVARDLAGLGLVVLRFDFAAEGDSTPVGEDAPRVHAWRRSIDMSLLREVTPWFLEQAGERELLVAGSCYGARLALEFAATEPVAKGVFLLVPYLEDREPQLRDAGEEDPPPRLDDRTWAAGATLNGYSELLAGFRACLARGPVWILVGEDEAESARRFERSLAATELPFELEIVPGMPELHPVTNPVQQDTARRRLVGRVRGALADRHLCVPS
jgi:dienelactone hydrolase